MKKLLFVLIVLVGGMFGNAVSAQTPNDITLEIVKELPIVGGSTKSPTLPLVITQNGHVLTLPGFSDDVVLQLLDEDGVVVYTLFIPAGTTIIVLPTALIGDFEIRFVADTYYYYGFISL